MKVLTNACAAMPLAAIALPGLSPSQPNQQDAEPDGDERYIAGLLLLTGREDALLRPRRWRPGREAGGGVHHKAAAEVDTPHCCRKPPPQIQCARGTYTNRLQTARKHEVAAEGHPVGEGAGDERRREGGHGELEDEESQEGDGGP